MTIDTIKNVLSRIISINKNLTEESLHNLLVASAWDDADIKEGLIMFNDYQKSGSINMAAKAEEDRVKAEEMQKVANEKSAELQRQQQEMVKAEERKVAEDLLKQKTFDIQKNEISNINNQDTNQIYQAPLQKENINVQSINSLLSPEKKILNSYVAEHSNNINTNPNQNFININHDPVTATPVNDNHIIHEEDASYYDKPVILILLDIVLFLSTLGLLVYILLK
jgi:hypothetical protein